MARSPRRRIPLASVAAGLAAYRTRLDSISLRQLDTSHGCRDHTVLPYATTLLVLRGSIAHSPKTSLRPPCNASHAQRHRVHRIPHSTYRDDAYAPLHEAGSREEDINFGKREAVYFCRAIWTTQITLKWRGKFDFTRSAFSLFWTHVARLALADLPDRQRRPRQDVCSFLSKQRSPPEPSAGSPD
jgi:hypothetical protein